MLCHDCNMHGLDVICINIILNLTSKMELIQELQQAYPTYQIVITVIIFIVYLIVKKILSKIILRRALLHNFDPTRLLYIKKTIKFSLVMVALIFVSMIWEISYEGISVYIASFITIIGVGLFATWSIVSNITASVILFFFFPLKIGSSVKILDADNSTEGVVIGISLFSIQIKSKDGSDVYVPNNLAIQRSIVHYKE